jgi:hypothetical protein
MLVLREREKKNNNNKKKPLRLRVVSFFVSTILIGGYLHFSNLKTQ